MSWLLAYYFFIIPNFQIKQEIIWTLLKKHHGLRFQLVKENKYSKTQKKFRHLIPLDLRNFDFLGDLNVEKTSDLVLARVIPGLSD